ncbi:MAG: hypothetical protein LQ351_006031 [Letrouitia transgressa]|nr:MAG: hypothetical protein LQ351_006031 [Letrouitia transgressa]
MTEDSSEKSSMPVSCRLVQTKLTSAFFKPRTKSPYFSRDAPTNKDPSPSYARDFNSDTGVDLYPSRRASLKYSPPPLPTSKRSQLLAAVAAETKSLLPDLMKAVPGTAPTSRFYQYHSLLPNPPHSCSGISKANVRVVNADTLDTAIALSTPTVETLPLSKDPPVLILNMANAEHGGGGWLKGALAQEEALCYRSSLSFALKRKFYPMPDLGAIYSPAVFVIRKSLADSHKLLDLTNPGKLPVVSVVSVAAIRDPKIEHILGTGEEKYKEHQEKELMRDKMRIVLRVACHNRHRKIVLGALGCGAFGNPKAEVVRLWHEVLKEKEFSGGWWEDLVFAVMEEGGSEQSDGNFGAFWRGLNDVEV